MRTALVFLAIGILLLLLLYSRVHVWFTDLSIIIHFHDTYYVVSRSEVVLATISFLGSLSAFGGAVGTRFRNKFFLIALAVFVMAGAYFVWTIYPLLKNL